LNHENIIETYKISSNEIIYKINNKRSNVYLIKLDNMTIMVDTSVKSDYLNIKNNLNKINVDNIDYLILTHIHFDHVSNALKFKNEYKCKIITNQDSVNLIENSKSEEIIGINLYSNLVSKIASKISKFTKYDKFEIDITFNSNEDFILGNKIQILSGPGHTNNSIIIIVNNEITLVGDDMFGIFKNRIYPPFVSDKESLIKTWKKLIDGNCSLFLPGHGESITKELLEKEYQRISKNIKEYQRISMK
jgi:hydroxyacylglutathione hydrolase